MHGVARAHTFRQCVVDVGYCSIRCLRARGVFSCFTLSRYSILGLNDTWLDRRQVDVVDGPKSIAYAIPKTTSMLSV